MHLILVETKINHKIEISTIRFVMGFGDCIVHNSSNIQNMKKTILIHYRKTSECTVVFFSPIEKIWRCVHHMLCVFLPFVWCLIVTMWIILSGSRQQLNLFIYDNIPFSSKLTDIHFRTIQEKNIILNIKWTPIFIHYVKLKYIYISIYEIIKLHHGVN